MCEIVLYRAGKVVLVQQFASKADALHWLSEQNLQNSENVLIRPVTGCVSTVATESFGDFGYNSR